MLPTLAPLSLSRSVVYKSHLAYIWFLSKIYLWSPYVRFLSSAVPIGFTIRHQCLILEIVDRVILVHLSPFQRNYVASYPMLRLWFWLAAHHHWWPHLFLCLITIFTEILRYIFSVYDEFVFTCLVRFCNLQNLHTCFAPHAAAGIFLVGVSGCAQRIKPRGGCRRGDTSISALQRTCTSSRFIQQHWSQNKLDGNMYTTSPYAALPLVIHNRHKTLV